MLRYWRILQQWPTSLRVAVGCTIVSISLLLMYLSAVQNRPELSDEPLARAEGVLYSKPIGNQRSVSFLVQEHGSTQLRKFIALSSYTAIKPVLHAGLGKPIVLLHDQQRVVSCEIDGVQACAALCGSVNECRMRRYGNNAATLMYTLYLLLFVASVAWVSYLLKRK